MEYESAWRLSFFLGGFIVWSALEYVLPYRKRNLSRLQRWPGNLSLSVLASMLIKFFSPLSLVGIALWAEEKNIGLFHLLNMQHEILNIILCLVIMDFAIYWQHVFSHRWPWLWCLHRVHHTDIDLDASSALRFHPLEIILSLMYKICWVLIFGLPAIGVLTFEIILNFVAMFNHSSLALPMTMEKWLRYIIVTPQMHIIHHSIERKEHDRNYGFNLSLWDRLFKTYMHKFISNGTIGLSHHRDKNENKIQRLLFQPFDENS